MIYTVLGEPVGKGRPRFVPGGRAITPPRTRAWEQSAAAEFAAQHRTANGPLPVLDGPLTLRVDALFARPSRLDCAHKRQPCSCAPTWRDAQRHLGRPDLDNVIKAVCDALVLGGVVRDDATIWRVTATKHYAAAGMTPRVEVTLTEAT